MLRTPESSFVPIPFALQYRIITMTVLEQILQKPTLRRSVPYGAPCVYEQLVEENQSILIGSSISIHDSGTGTKRDDSLSSVLISLDNHSKKSDDDGSYSYSYSSIESNPRLGATPSAKKFLSISPVKKREENDTLDIPGCSDFSFDISRMSMPAAIFNHGNCDDVAQDATTTRMGDNGSPNGSSNTTETNISALSQQLEAFGLRLASLEKAVYSDNNLTQTISDVCEQNIAFIVEEDDSTVETLTNHVVLSEEKDRADRDGRRQKLSQFVRFFFFGGCRKH